MRRWLVLVSVATLCVGHILVTDTRAELLHERGVGYVVLACLGTAFMLSLNTSWAWMCAAGGLANLIDVRDGSIEDPFLLAVGSSYVAFNQADQDEEGGDREVVRATSHTDHA